MLPFKRLVLNCKVSPGMWVWANCSAVSQAAPGVAPSLCFFFSDNNQGTAFTSSHLWPFINDHQSLLLISEMWTGMDLPKEEWSGGTGGSLFPLLCFMLWKAVVYVAALCSVVRIWCLLAILTVVSSELNWPQPTQMLTKKHHIVRALLNWAAFWVQADLGGSLSSGTSCNIAGFAVCLPCDLPGTVVFLSSWSEYQLLDAIWSPAPP